MMSKIALEQQTQALELGKLDKDISAGINDGFAYNVQGNRMKNANGQPIQYKMSMSDIEKLQAQNNFATKLA